MKRFLATILSIIVVCLLIVFTFCFVLRSKLSKESILKAVNDNDLSVFITKIDNQELLDISRKVFKTLSMPEDSIEQVLNSKATKNFLGIYTFNAINAVIDPNGQDIKVTKEDIEALVKDNILILQQDLSKEEQVFLESYEEKAYEYLDSHADEIINMLPSPKDIMNKIDQDNLMLYENISLKDVTDFIRLIKSNVFLISLACGILLLLFIIYLLVRKRCFKYYASLGFVYSFLMVLVEIVILTVLKSEYLDKLASFGDLVNNLINSLSKSIWLFIIPGFIISIICSVIYKKKVKS